MTGGSEGSFGSGGGPPYPADPSEDEHAASVFHDGEVDESTGGHRADGAQFDSSVDDIEIPRHSMPFRKWSAAYGYADSPSLWERFRAWLAGLLGRKQVEGEADQSEEIAGAVADNLDAPWGEPLPVAEVSSNRESRELPHLDDFEPPWDDPYASHDSQAIDEPSPTVVPSAPESTTPDPLWDEPRVATSANAPAEAISRSDLDFVWAPPGPEEVDLLAESRSATASPESGDTPAAPKRLSFISRLFSRKKKRRTGGDRQRL